MRIVSKSINKTDNTLNEQYIFLKIKLEEEKDKQLTIKKALEIIELKKERVLNEIKEKRSPRLQAGEGVVRVCDDIEETSSI